MRNSITNAAVASYVSSMTRYICTNNHVDLELAKVAVRWINSTLELYGKPHFRTTENGLLDVPFILDKKACDERDHYCFWFRADNMFQPTKDSIKDCLKPGDTLKMIYMEDEQPIEPGSIGTIDHIDDAGTLHMRWENGRSLGVCMPAGDLFEVYYAS